MLCGFKMTPAKLFSAFKFHFVFCLKVELQNIIVLSLSALEKYLRCQWEAWFEWKGSRSNMQGLAMEPVSGRPGKRKNDWKGGSPAPRKLSWPRTVHEPGPFTGILHKSSATLSWLDTYFQTRTCQPNLIRGFTQYPPKTHCPWENSST